VCHACFEVQSREQYHYLMGHLRFPAPVPGFVQCCRRRHQAGKVGCSAMSLVQSGDHIRPCFVDRSTEQCHHSMHGHYLMGHYRFPESAPGFGFVELECWRRQHQAGKVGSTQMLVTFRPAGPVAVCCNK